VSQNVANRPHEIERRALVGIACALVVLHAFLATIAWPLPRLAADPAVAICHSGGSTGETGAPDPATGHASILCGLCAHALAGMGLPATAGTIGRRATASLAVGHRELRPIRVAAVPARAGASRAPPQMI
jgi:hypothetical protein